VRDIGVQGNECVLGQMQTAIRCRDGDGAHKTLNRYKGACLVLLKFPSWFELKYCLSEGPALENSDLPVTMPELMLRLQGSYNTLQIDQIGIALESLIRSFMLYFQPDTS